MDDSAPRRADYRLAESRYPSAASWDGQPAGEPVTGPGRGEPGLPGSLALVVLLAIAGVGGAIDVVSGSSVRGGFNIGLVIGSIAGILAVRRRNMLTIVVAPPLTYAAASIALLWVRSGGLHNRKVLLDAAVNWLVYGFPAMAVATAAVLIIAAVRLLRGSRRSAQPAAPEPRPAQPVPGRYPPESYYGGYPADPNPARRPR